MHPARRAVVEYLVTHPGPHATAFLKGKLRLPKTMLHRHLEDLNALGVIDLVAEHPEQWSASQWLRERWWATEQVCPARSETDIEPDDPDPAAKVQGLFPGAEEVT